MVDDPMQWMDDAACKGQTWITEAVSTDGGTGGATERARQVCNTCPVYAPCLDFARSLDATGIPGVLAGLTPTQRGQVECSECGTSHPKKDTLHGRCWRCWHGREAVA